MAYFLLNQPMHWRSAETEGTSVKPLNSKANDEYWKAILKLNIPNSVKLFLQRACHDILSTSVNLCKREVTDHILCLICTLEEKTIAHAHWVCSATNDVWGEDRSPLRKWMISSQNFKDLQAEIVNKMSIKTQELCALFFGIFG